MTAPLVVPACRVAGYVRGRRGAANPSLDLTHRHAHLAATVATWPGCVLVGVYANTADSVVGVSRLLADAGARWFDVLVVEDPAGLSPRGLEAPAVLSRLAACGVSVRVLPRRRGRLAALALAVGIVTGLDVSG